MNDYGFIGLLGWIGFLIAVFGIVLTCAIKNSENNVLRFQLERYTHKDDGNPHRLGAFYKKFAEPNAHVEAFFNSLREKKPRKRKAKVAPAVG